MAVQKHTAPQSHAAHFTASLSTSQRNHLRVLLLHEHACRDLRRALGINKAEAISHAQHATGWRAGAKPSSFSKTTPSITRPT